MQSQPLPGVNQRVDIWFDGYDEFYGGRVESVSHPHKFQVVLDDNTTWTIDTRKHIFRLSNLPPTESDADTEEPPPPLSAPTSTSADAGPSTRRAPPNGNGSGSSRRRSTSSARKSVGSRSGWSRVRRASRMSAPVMASEVVDLESEGVTEDTEKNEQKDGHFQTSAVNNPNDTESTVVGRLVNGIVRDGATTPTVTEIQVADATNSTGEQKTNSKDVVDNDHDPPSPPLIPSSQGESDTLEDEDHQQQQAQQQHQQADTESSEQKQPPQTDQSKTTASETQTEPTSEPQAPLEKRVGTEAIPDPHSSTPPLTTLSSFSLNSTPPATTTTTTTKPAELTTPTKAPPPSTSTPTIAKTIIASDRQMRRTSGRALRKNTIGPRSETRMTQSHSSSTETPAPGTTTPTRRTSARAIALQQQQQAAMQHQQQTLHIAPPAPGMMPDDDNDDENIISDSRPPPASKKAASAAATNAKTNTRGGTRATRSTSSSSSSSTPPTTTRVTRKRGGSSGGTGMQQQARKRRMSMDENDLNTKKRRLAADEADLVHSNPSSSLQQQQQHRRRPSVTFRDEVEVFTTPRYSSPANSVAAKNNSRGGTQQAAESGAKSSSPTKNKKNTGIASASTSAHSRNQSVQQTIELEEEEDVNEGLAEDDMSGRGEAPIGKLDRKALLGIDKASGRLVTALAVDAALQAAKTVIDPLNERLTNLLSDLETVSRDLLNQKKAFDTELASRPPTSAAAPLPPPPSEPQSSKQQGGATTEAGNSNSVSLRAIPKSVTIAALQNFQLDVSEVIGGGEARLKAHNSLSQQEFGMLHRLIESQSNALKELDRLLYAAQGFADKAKDKGIVQKQNNNVAIGNGASASRAENATLLHEQAQGDMTMKESSDDGRNNSKSRAMHSQSRRQSVAAKAQHAPTS